MSDIITAKKSELLALLEQSYNAGAVDALDSVRDAVNAGQEHCVVSKEVAQLVRAVLDAAGEGLQPKPADMLGKRSG